MSAATYTPHGGGVVAAAHLFLRGTVYTCIKHYGRVCCCLTEASARASGESLLKNHFILIDSGTQINPLKGGKFFILRNNMFFWNGNKRMKSAIDPLGPRPPGSCACRSSSKAVLKPGFSL